MNHELYRNSSGLLVLKKSRIREAGILIFTFLCLCIWYGLFLNARLERYSPLFLIFYVVPLVGTKKYIRTFRAVVYGECYEFDENTASVKLNHTVLVRFDDLRGIKLSKQTSTEGPDSYRLVLVSKSGKNFELDHSVDEKRLADWASTIAGTTGVPVMH